MKIFDIVFDKFATLKKNKKKEAPEALYDKWSKKIKFKKTKFEKEGKQISLQELWDEYRKNEK